MAERNYAPVHEVTMYQARCTHCGRVETDYGDYTAMGDPHAPIEQVTEFWGWWEVVEWTPELLGEFMDAHRVLGRRV